MFVTTHIGTHEVKLFTREECQYSLSRNRQGEVVRRHPTFNILVHDKGRKKVFYYGKARLIDGCMWIYNRHHCRKYIHPNLPYVLNFMLEDYIKNRNRRLWTEYE